MAFIGMPVLVYFGMVDGVEGARYVVQFYVWGVVLPISLLTLHPAVQEHIANTPARGPVKMFITHVVAWSCLGVMVWTGNMATASAWMICMFCGAIARAGAEKIRTAMSKNVDS